MFDMIAFLKVDRFEENKLQAISLEEPPQMPRLMCWLCFHQQKVISDGPDCRSVSAFSNLAKNTKLQIDLRHLLQSPDSDVIDIGIDLQDYYISGMI